MNARHGALILGLVVISAIAAARMQQPFPHERHTRLFPVCVGCHEGVTTGEAAAVYPQPQSCGLCHDGERVARIEWAGPAARVSNLRFAHPAHADALEAADSAALDCAACHTAAGAPRMRVERPIPERCFECHAHTATQHMVDARCDVCHRPLVETGFSASRIALLPVPPTHLADDFLASDHGRLASAASETCATCHAREQCLGCHVSVAEGSVIERIPASLGRIEPVAIPARYPVPASHLERDWETAHGAVATPADCGTCHTRESCTGCHTAAAAPVVGRLASRADAAAPGVATTRRLPSSHESAFFATAHGPLATARPRSCATCHDRSRFCGACHETGTAAASDAAVAAAPPAATLAARLDHRHAPAPASPARGERTAAAGNARGMPPAPASIAAATDAPPPVRQPRGGFHPPNYVLRHPAEAFGRRLDCSTCHSTQLFCRACHEGAGLGSSGRLGPGYHDAEPVWLLRHGQAARQTLETCAACHAQRDCMQCHSQLGSFRISPHGPGFDARRAQRTNPQICRACHLGDPLRGG